jgi:cation diffusion facilitator CzcD-associated flavoprotein CzcO
MYRSYAWPKYNVSFKNKRIAVIGTGATAVQIIPVVAHEAKTLTVFQRTANHVLPARNHPLTDEQQRDIKDRYEEVWQTARSEIFGMHFINSKLLELESLMHTPTY